MKTELRVLAYRQPDGQKMQRLVKRWILGPFVLWQEQIGEAEEVPRHVEICLGAFGDTGGWISRFAPFDHDGSKT